MHLTTAITILPLLICYHLSAHIHIPDLQLFLTCALYALLILLTPLAAHTILQDNSSSEPRTSQTIEEFELKELLSLEEAKEPYLVLNIEVLPTEKSGVPS